MLSFVVWRCEFAESRVLLLSALWSGLCFRAVQSRNRAKPTNSARGLVRHYWHGCQLGQYGRRKAVYGSRVPRRPRCEFRVGARGAGGGESEVVRAIWTGSLCLIYDIMITGNEYRYLKDPPCAVPVVP